MATHRQPASSKLGALAGATPTILILIVLPRTLPALAGRQALATHI